MKRFITEFTVPPDDSEGLGGVKFEDGGQAAVMYQGLEGEPKESGGDGCFFIRFHSWDAKRQHPLFRELMGKKVRVTIETID